MIHLSNRIDRMPIDTSKQEEINFKNEATATLLTLESDLDDRVKPDETEIDLSSTFAFNQPIANSCPTNSFSHKIVPIYKWDVKFDGSKSGLGLKAFLERVTELSDARHVTKQMLFESAVDLFSGKALLWYRQLKESKIIKDWDYLVQQLENDFLDLDYDEELCESINNRKQQKDESVVIYAAIIESLFNRLSNKPAVVTRIKWIRKNLKQDYVWKLALNVYNTVNELIRDAKTLESVLKEQYRTSNKPSCNILNSYIDFELGTASSSSKPQPQNYNNNKTYNNKKYPQNQNNFSRRQKPEIAVTNSNQKQVICWNCKGPNHTFHSCTMKRSKFCFKCGNSGVTIKTCENCLGNTGNR